MDGPQIEGHPLVECRNWQYVIPNICLSLVRFESKLIELGSRYHFVITKSVSFGDWPRRILTASACPKPPSSGPVSISANSDGCTIGRPTPVVARPHRRLRMSSQR